jgi:hypothetical protein
MTKIFLLNTCLLKLSVLSCVSVFLCNCSSPKETKINTIDIEEAETECNYRDYVDSRSLIKLETTRESLLGEVSQIQLFEDRLFILDGQVGQLLVFNRDGSFSHKIGQRGRGANEYLAIHAFYIHPEKKQITLFDPLGLKALIYDLHGRFIEQKYPEKEVMLQGIRNASYFRKGQIVCYAPPNSMMEDILFILDEKDLSFVKVWSKNRLKSIRSFIPWRKNRFRR